ncbi:hypothetical protein predicted by Glimmer/Critica [Sorangium cellulosum So ce56]|uniref:Uncharacterized protein n=1 Tax=Sorangium cellulosum (strain So ce56) TaxID=448385 RepID=A9EQT0_SORC5|nr:hypothetical protein predicted by Glimmer/Critica [Sorangium cellulosum So ce56]
MGRNTNCSSPSMSTRGTSARPTPPRSRAPTGLSAPFEREPFGDLEARGARDVAGQNSKAFGGS